MRQIVLDTETTGLGADKGHRIIEIGCVELVDRKLTGHHFHTYLNPEREVDEGAYRVHGISRDFLEDKPYFREISNDFIEYVDGAELIIHNAPFDVGFLNAELKKINHRVPLETMCTILDTLVFARKKHPGQRNTLDALCKRYDIDNSNRTLHGALMDAEILALVYLAMTGGQSSLLLDEVESEKTLEKATERSQPLMRHPTRVIPATAEEMAAHEGMVEWLVKKSGANYWG